MWLIFVNSVIKWLWKNSPSATTRNKLKKELPSPHVFPRTKYAVTTVQLRVKPVVKTKWSPQLLMVMFWKLIWVSTSMDILPKLPTLLLPKLIQRRLLKERRLMLFWLPIRLSKPPSEKSSQETKTTRMWLLSSNKFVTPINASQLTEYWASN